MVSSITMGEEMASGWNEELVAFFQLAATYE